MASSPTGKQRVYVGTYTSGKSRGVYQCELDTATGALGNLRLGAELSDPTYLAMDARAKFLYAVGSQESPGTRPGGKVTALSIDLPTGKLAVLNQQSVPGANPCHLAIDRTGRFVLTANYGDGTASVFPIHPDGSLGSCCEHVQHHGNSVYPKRQTGPHAHSVNVDPTGRWALVADLGIDRVMVYRLDATKGRLTLAANGQVPVKAGAGPRHLCFNRTGRQVYLVTELSNEMIVFSFDPADGKMVLRQTLSTLPAGFIGESWGAGVEVHPSGKFVYASNRVHDSMAIFTVDRATGRLNPASHEPTQGNFPRGFGLDPEGRFLLVANQRSDNLVSFRVEEETGRLIPTGSALTVPEPTCVLVCAASA